MVRTVLNALHSGGWDSTLKAWAAVGLILGSTYALVFATAMAPHDWAAHISFVAAHLAATEAIMAEHRTK